MVAAHDETLVITAKIKEIDVMRVLGDECLLSHILFRKTLDKLGRMRNDLKRVDSHLFRLAKQMTHPIGEINLPVV